MKQIKEVRELDFQLVAQPAAVTAADRQGCCGAGKLVIAVHSMLLDMIVLGFSRDRKIPGH